VPRTAAAAAPAAARMADGDLLAAFLQLPEARQQVRIRGLAGRRACKFAHVTLDACRCDQQQPGEPHQSCNAAVCAPRAGTNL
jgi:hypothetical protein